MLALELHYLFRLLKIPDADFALKVSCHQTRAVFKVQNAVHGRGEAGKLFAYIQFAVVFEAPHDYCGVEGAAAKQLRGVIIIVITVTDINVITSVIVIII